MNAIEHICMNATNDIGMNATHSRCMNATYVYICMNITYYIPMNITWCMHECSMKDMHEYNIYAWKQDITDACIQHMIYARMDARPTVEDQLQSCNLDNQESASRNVLKLFDFIVVIARMRVILCLANCNQQLGWLLFPFVFVAKKLMGWRESSWILGCSCDAGDGGLMITPTQ